MISRRTTFLLAQLFERGFEKGYFSTHRTYYTMSVAQVYDFLYQEDYPAWFCNEASGAANLCTDSTRPFKDFVLKVHTRESLQRATPNWSWPQREKLGQELLRDLAEDLTSWWKQATYVRSDVNDVLARLRSSLELDGYIFRGDALLAPEEDVLDAKEQGGVLQDLYAELGLQNQDTVFHHLALSEEHYMAKRWDDSISNSRKFLEGVLQEVAASHHLASRGSAIPEEAYS